ncbi:phosphotransferase [Paenibacillus sp. GCM10012306]|uniref:phosphotransferase n=1 Tax=Paenibacillus sp. GCM10012306 TaxID=3317342 RepID=UPI003610C3DC
MHANFQLGNIVVSEGNTSLIDFCLFGYGHYCFDLGSASSMLKSELRTTFLEGYASLMIRRRMAGLKSTLQKYAECIVEIFLLAKRFTTRCEGI